VNDRPDGLNRFAELRSQLAQLRDGGQVIGLVPTMGALHAGHAALIERARADCNAVVVSIFVNPIQFDRRDDYDAYTIDLAKDVEFCAALGADFVFAPSAPEMYPEPASTFVEVAGVSAHLCGKFRPGHFRGVATVVAKLFNIIAPHKAYFGEKDAQQLAVIERMVADLNMPIEIVSVLTVREPDGLAVSSRNSRLTGEERQAAAALYQALKIGEDCIRKGWTSAAQVRSAALAHLQQPPWRVEYLEVVDASSMTPVAQVAGPVRIAAAAWLGAVRLIDNVRVDKIQT
jgi:pantoate--beta-alanine ligase